VFAVRRAVSVGFVPFAVLLTRHFDSMNDRQNTVVATAVAGLVLVVVFLCPWRVETSGEIRWSPIYQPPLAYVRSYDPDIGSTGGSRMEAADAHIAIDILALEVVLLGAASGLLFVMLADNEGREGDPSATRR